MLRPPVLGGPPPGQPLPARPAPRQSGPGRFTHPILLGHKTVTARDVGRESPDAFIRTSVDALDARRETPWMLLTARSTKSSIGSSRLFRRTSTPVCATTRLRASSTPSTRRIGIRRLMQLSAFSSAPSLSSTADAPPTTKTERFAQTVMHTFSGGNDYSGPIPSALPRKLAIDSRSSPTNVVHLADVSPLYNYVS